MGQNDFQWASTPNPSDLPVRNYGLTDIPQFTVVKLDTGNLVNGTNETTGIVQAGSGDRPLGVTVEDIPAGKQGRLRTQGWIPVTAEAAVSAGAQVIPGFQGDVKTQGGTSPALGVALDTAAALGDTIRVQIAFSY